jgi:hypothetical protein
MNDAKRRGGWGRGLAVLPALASALLPRFT